MKSLWAGIVLALSFIAPALAADAQQTTSRVRGTITGYDGKVLAVKSREGKDLKVQLADNATVSYPKTIALADLKPGQFVAITSTRNGEGKLVAREVRTLPPVNEGHRPHDLEPGSTMTNAILARAVKSTNAHELTVEYKGGSQTILVQDSTSIVANTAGDRSLLVPGAYVYVIANVGPDDSLSARSVTVSKDGVRPGQ